MDFRRPISAVVPGVAGSVLDVLAGTTTPLSVRALAELAHVSVAQASRLLPQLASLGVVERTDVPPATLYRLVPEHVATRALLELARARTTALEEMADLAKAIEPPPTAVIVFGSFARGEARADSDIDVLIVRPNALEAEDERWGSALAQWTVAVRRLTGNQVAVLEMDGTEVASAWPSGRALWRDLRRDGVLLMGAVPLDATRASA